MERRRARLDKIRAETEKAEGHRPTSGLAREQIEFSPDCRYSLGVNRNRVVRLRSLGQHPDLRDEDPYAAVSLNSIYYLAWDRGNDGSKQDFIPKLKQHLLPRILWLLGHEELPSDPDAWTDVVLEEDDRIYSHKIMRMTFTTYDVRRDEDVIHVDTPQCNVMLLNAEYDARCSASVDRSHPYLYAKIVGIYHANVRYLGNHPDGTRSLASHRMDFALAHWYKLLGPREEFTLDRLALSPLDCDTALSFVDPEDIIRAVHIIPQFSLGKKEVDGIQKSVLVGTGAQDFWNAYYLNRSVVSHLFIRRQLAGWADPDIVRRFADRDLFMRYQYGMSVGHTYMQKPNFPQATVPTIPPSFDYHLTAPASSQPETEGSGSDSSSSAVAMDPPEDGEDDEDEDVGSDADDDKEEDYVDTLEDREFAALNDMYGDEGWDSDS